MAFWLYLAMIHNYHWEEKSAIKRPDITGRITFRYSCVLCHAELVLGFFRHQEMKPMPRHFPPSSLCTRTRHVCVCARMFAYTSLTVYCDGFGLLRRRPGLRGLLKR